MVLQFSSDDSECVVDEVMVDVNLRESVRRSGRDPLLVAVVVNHHRRARRRDALLWPLVTEKKRLKFKSIRKETNKLKFGIEDFDNSVVDYLR